MKKLLVFLLSFNFITTSTSSLVSCGTKYDNSAINGEVSFYMLSIGNGQFTFLKYNNDKAIVFDAGVGGNPEVWHEDMYRKNPFPSEFMKNEGVKEIEAVFISHDHTDHYSNLWKVDEQFKINNLVLPYNNKNLLKKIKNKSILFDYGKDINIISKFQKDYTFDNIKFNNLSFDIKDYLESTMKQTKDENNRSMVVNFKINDVSFLITGDTEAKEATQLVKANNLPKVDFYQVPHHGSANSAGSNFLKKIAPKYCFISGTSGDSEIESWSNFDGGHPFPTASALNNLSKNCSKEVNLTGSPYQDNTKLLTNYNYSYKFNISKEHKVETFKIDKSILDTLK